MEEIEFDILVYKGEKVIFQFKTRFFSQINELSQASGFSRWAAEYQAVIMHFMRLIFAILT